MRKLLRKLPSQQPLREEQDGVRGEHHCGSGEAGEPAQDPRTGWPSSWTRVSLGAERTELGWRKPLYLPVFLRSRKHSRVASSSSPTRTPITMPEMVPTGWPVLFFPAERRRKGGRVQPKSIVGKPQGLAGGGPGRAKEPSPSECGL